MYQFFQRVAKLSIILLLLTVAGIFNWNAAAQNLSGVNRNEPRAVEYVSKTFAVNSEIGVPNIVIKTFDGRISVHRWDTPEVKLTAVKSAQDEYEMRGITLKTDTSKGDILIAADFDKAFSREINYKGQKVLSNSASAEFEVYAPRNVNLHASSGDGDIRIDGVTGDLDLTTKDGAVEVSNAQGRLRLETDDGQIDVKNFNGEATVMSGDGQINLDGRFTQLAARTKDGEISLTLSSGVNAFIETISESVSNKAGLTVADNNNDSPQNVRRWKVGSGGETFKLSTEKGSIYLRRAGKLLSNKQIKLQKISQITTPSLSENLKNEELIARLQKTIPQIMKEGEVPGFSVTLIRKGEIVWHQGFGVKNAETKEPVDNATVFEAASLSKPVFAYAVMKLVESGKLDLDAPLSKYLPAPYVENDERLNLITARRVLSHTAGFPNWRPKGQPLKIHFTPGEKFSYSGEGIIYLQKVVEQITKEPLNEFMTRIVFQPLGMTSSSYVWQERYETLKATAHNADGELRGKNKQLEARAASSLQTTALDYAKFVTAVMNHKGIKEATVREMLRPQVKVDEGCVNCVEGKNSGRISPSISWGLGWGLQQTAEGDSFWHWGDNGHTKAYVVGLNKEKSGVVVFSNSANGLSIVDEIVNQAVGSKQPALAWLNVEPYNSPAKMLARNILAKGEVAINGYRRQNENKLSETQMNDIGYFLLRKNKIKEAIEVFKLNVETHPNSANAYDSLGEAYSKANNKELAIVNYKKSLELNPQNKDAAEKLKQLEKQ